MGRWTQTQYDRVLVEKLRWMYDACNDAPAKGDDVDLRFRSFIRALDPQDKAIQSCFRSLIQRVQVSQARKQISQRPLTDFLPDIARLPSSQAQSTLPTRSAEASSSGSLTPRPYAPAPPQRVHTRLSRTYRQDASTVTSENSRVDEALSRRRPLLRLQHEADNTPAQGDHDSIRRTWEAESSRSGAASPSRIRRLGLDPTTLPFLPRPRTRTASPPTAASQAWLDEVDTLRRAVRSAPRRPGTVIGRDDEQDVTRAFGASEDMLGAFGPEGDDDEEESGDERLDAGEGIYFGRHPNRSGFEGGLPSGLGRRRREADDAGESDDDTTYGLLERARQRRRLSRPPPVPGYGGEDERTALFGLGPMAGFEPEPAPARTPDFGFEDTIYDGVMRESEGLELFQPLPYGPGPMAVDRPASVERDSRRDGIVFDLDGPYDSEHDYLFRNLAREFEGDDHGDVEDEDHYW